MTVNWTTHCVCFSSYDILLSYSKLPLYEVLRIGLLVFAGVTLLTGAGVGINFGVQKNKEKNELIDELVKEKFLVHLG